MAETLILPLTPGQRALFFLSRLAPASGAYTIGGAARVGAGKAAPAPGPERLRRAFEAVVARHPALRATFRLDAAGEPVQEIRPDVRLDWTEVDATGWSDEELPGRLADFFYTPFDLAAGPPLRVGVFRRSEGDLLVLALHHLVGDLWSLALVVRELDRALAALAAAGDDPGAAGPASDAAGRTSDAAGPASDAAGAARPLLPPGADPYPEVVEARLGRLEEPATEASWRFWRRHLDPVPPPLDLPGDRPRPQVQTLTGGSRTARLDRPEGLGRRLAALGRERGANLFVVLLAGFQAVLGRWSGQDDFLVGTPTTGRLGPDRRRVAGVVGYLVNPVPVRARLAGDPTFGELVERLRDETATVLEHQEFPFPLLAERLAEERTTERDAARPPLVQAMVTWQKSPVAGGGAMAAFALGQAGGEMILDGLTLAPVALPRRGAQLDLNLYLSEGPDRELAATLEYASDLFDPATADRLLGHLATLLAAAADDPERRVRDLPLLTAAERDQLLDDWSGAGRGVPESLALPAAEATLDRLVWAQAATTPEREALVAGEERLTYRELVGRAERLAARLVALGVGPEVRVGVFLERSADLVAVLLAVHRAGGAYVPLDPGYPAERLELILADAAAPVVVTRRELAGRLPEGAGGRRLLLDNQPAAGEAVAGEAPPARATPDGLSHLVYTSGSTGRPKGVAIRHRAATALVAWAAEAFEPEELSGMLAVTSVCFDLSVFELFVPLALGGRVILAPDALALAGLPAAGEVTLVNTVPSAAAELVAAGALPAGVRTVGLAGEPLRRRLADAVHSAVGAGGAGDRGLRLLNLYGPSEDTTYSTWAEVAPGEDAEPTIGRPLPGTRAYVADSGLRPLPAGVPGELLLAGAGLARGYLGRPAATAAAFVPDPFAPPGAAGERLYRTGDRVRWLPDGRLEFLGRLDHQVKVRGFRVEPGEIEAALVSLPAVAEAAVVPGGDGDLVAYLVPEGAEGIEAPAPDELARSLGERLPAYMVPSWFVVLAELPRTPNGKLDRRALPAPDRSAAPAAASEPPSTALEMALAEIWREVLGVEEVGVRDSFFALGGHSLKGMRLLNEVRATFGVEVPVERLFAEPTLAALAEAVGEAMLAAADDETLAEVLGSDEP